MKTTLVSSVVFSSHPASVLASGNRTLILSSSAKPNLVEEIKKQDQQKAENASGLLKKYSEIVQKLVVKV